MLEDEVLKWKFKRGSDEALTRIYEKYLGPMLTLAMGLLNDAAEAEDVVQDVFVSFAQSGRTFRPRGSLSGYLATSVVNRVRDRKRSLTRRVAHAARPSQRVGVATRPDRRVILDEQAQLLNDAVAELPDEQREVVLLRLKADMRFRDIAKLQQTSVNTALSRYRYGLEKLRSTLNGEVKE
jgi:RNA polymerase sigma-70 factor (ECF subfamily)